MLPFEIRVGSLNEVPLRPRYATLSSPPARDRKAMAGDCGSTCPTQAGFYTYVPTVAGNATLLAVFAILVPVVVFQGVRFRTPWFSLMVTAGLLAEALAFLGRVLLSGSRKNQSFFTTFLVGSVLGPPLLGAGIFQVLTQLLKPYDGARGVFRPLHAAAMIQCSNLIALAIQVVGSVFMAYDSGSLGVSPEERP